MSRRQFVEPPPCPNCGHVDFKHGNSGYTHGCRCDICRGARVKSVREYRERQRAERLALNPPKPKKPKVEKPMSVSYHRLRRVHADELYEAMMRTGWNMHDLKIESGLSYDVIRHFWHTKRITLISAQRLAITVAAALVNPRRKRDEVVPCG